MINRPTSEFWLRAAAFLFVPTTLPTPSQAEQIALTPYLGAAWSLRAHVGGRNQTFLLDTAGGITVITPETAAAIGCRPWGQLTGHRMRGDRVDLTRCDGMTMRVGSTFLSLPTVGVIDLKKFLPADAPPLAGSLALDALAGRIVTLDLSRRTVVIETRLSARRRIRRATEVKLRLAREIGGLALVPFIAVKTKLGDAWMELDTGSDSSVIVANHIASLFAMEPDRSKQAFSATIGDGLVLRSSTAKSSALVIDGNIGNRVLDHWVVTLDLARARAWISPSS